MGERFLTLYDKVGPAKVAEVFSALTGVDRSADVVKQWALKARRGQDLPDLVVPWLPQLVRLLELEVSRG